MNNELRKGGYLFTGESVVEGHPDKVCDQISDSILDAFITSDPNARVACETMVVPNHMILSGEISLICSFVNKKIEPTILKLINLSAKKMRTYLSLNKIIYLKIITQAHSRREKIELIGKPYLA